MPPNPRKLAIDQVVSLQVKNNDGELFEGEYLLVILPSSVPCAMQSIGRLCPVTSKMYSSRFCCSHPGPSPPVDAAFNPSTCFCLRLRVQPFSRQKNVQNREADVSREETSSQESDLVPQELDRVLTCGSS
ncbi:Zinc Transporter Zip5 [Manis pentadactyla]|nr:Zinc Transporter Zip5 [Manis pentadactyla]